MNGDSATPFIEQRLVGMFCDSTILICPTRTHAGLLCVFRNGMVIADRPVEDLRTLRSRRQPCQLVVSGLRMVLTEAIMDLTVLA